MNVFYIIDTYSRFHKNTDVCMVFTLYSKWYCIRKITQLEWGQPIFEEKDLDDEYTNYHLFSTLDEAKLYVRSLRKLEGIR